MNLLIVLTLLFSCTSESDITEDKIIEEVVIKAKPTVETVEIIDVESYSVTVNSKITDNGSSSVTKRGVTWNTTGNPTMDNDTFSGSNLAQTADSFSTIVNNLEEQTTYYFKSYAVNAEGTSYSQETEVTTKVKTEDVITDNTHVFYTLHKVDNPTNAESELYDLIEEAMDKACEYYSDYTEIVQHVNVYYNSGVATADGNSNGTIRFGARSSMNYITAMHEIAHTLGVGTKWTWSNLLVDGVYNGENANQLYREIAGDDSVSIHGDGSHFWPYGLNYTSEVKSEADVINHCKILEAMIADGL